MKMFYILKINFKEIIQVLVYGFGNSCNLSENYNYFARYRSRAVAIMRQDEAIDSS